jgi:VWFA-related protein
LIPLAGISLICVVLLLCASASPPAQQSQLSFPDSTELEHEPMPDPTHGMIRLDVEVRDRSGSPVIGLNPRDFTFKDNGQPGKIVSFQAFDGARAKPDPSVEVILVIDELNMNSQGEGKHPSAQLLAAEGEAENLLRQHQGDLAEPVMIYRISRDGLSASAQPSMDGNALADQVAHRSEPVAIWKSKMVFETPRMGLGLGSSIVNFNVTRSLTALGSIAIEERRRPGRKLMFWLGPGWQTDAAMGPGPFDLFTEISTRLREARINLWEATAWPFRDVHGNPVPIRDFVYPEYLAGVKRETQDFAYLALNVLATQSGGGVLKTKEDLSALISKRVKEASHFYSLTFDPPRTDQVDEYHHLEIEAGKPDLTAFTWTGYFDEPVFYDQPNAGTERITVEQLEHALKASRTSSDARLAQQLSAMELTERLSSTRLADLQSSLRGKKARQALVALADESVFLTPPASEILSTAPPDAGTQRLLISRAVQYVRENLPRMPDFFADRTTALYHQVAPQPSQAWKTAMGDPSLRIGDTINVSVMIRDGKEVVSGEAAKGRRDGSLKTIGTFGPVLAMVLGGATTPQSDLTWSRWEQGKNGREAVFRYHARPEKPLYIVGADYLARDDKAVPFQKSVSFYGEFAIDPESGAILLLTMKADLEPRLPVDQSGIMVEYGPVLIGGNTYICPLRSVSISRQRRIMDLHEWGEDLKVYAPFETLLNDMVFRKYHLFHSTARMLPGFTAAPKDN